MRITNPFAVYGEDYACEYLQKKGYKILERNFRKGYGEIDIIATHHNILIFVEVKTRSSAFFGSPFDSIVGAKLRTLMKTAEYFKYSHSGLPDAMRIDAIGIVTGSDKKVREIEHLENVTGY